MGYINWINKSKTAKGDTPFIYAKGAWINFRTTSQFVELLPSGNFNKSEKKTTQYRSFGIDDDIDDPGTDDNFCIAECMEV